MRNLIRKVLREEFTRVSLTPEEKVKIKEITRKFITMVNDKRFAGGTNEKYVIEYDLGNLKKIIQTTDYDKLQHQNDGWKKVDSAAKQLSNLRGTNIIFDRKDNCFKTSSGKALCTFHLVSKTEHGEQNPHFYNRNLKVFINYKTGEIFNDLNKFKPNSDYIGIWDFTGGNIYLPINTLRKVKEKDLNIDIFSILFHEFTHAKDPNTWLDDLTYKTPEQIKKGAKGSYASNPREIQTMCNNLLEILGYYFERTWRGDTDGGGINLNLTKDEVIKTFIPTISEVRDFINGKRENLSEMVIKQLSGTNKTTTFIKKVVEFISEIKKEAPDKMKFVQEWMKDDMTKLIETYNKKVTEINKNKSESEKIPLVNVSR